MFKKVKKAFPKERWYTIIFKFEDLENKKIHCTATNGIQSFEFDFNCEFSKNLENQSIRIENTLDVLANEKLLRFQKEGKKLIIYTIKNDIPRCHRFDIYDPKPYEKALKQIKSDFPIVGKAEVKNLKKRLYHFLKNYKNFKDYHIVVFDGFNQEIALLTCEVSGNLSYFRIIERIKTNYQGKFVAIFGAKNFYQFLAISEPKEVEFMIAANKSAKTPGFIAKAQENLLMGFDIRRTKPFLYLRNRDKVNETISLR